MLGVAASACTYLETIGRRNNNCFEKVQTFLLVQAIQEDRKKAEIGSIIYEVRHSPQYKMWLERIWTDNWMFYGSLRRRPWLVM